MTSGFHFLQGTTIGLELLQTIKRETNALGRYILDVVSETDECFRNVTTTITSMENKMEKTLNAIEQLRKDVDEIKTSQNQQTDVSEELHEDIKNIKTKIAVSDTEHEETSQKMNKMSEDISKHETRLDELDKQMSSTRPRDKMYFYPPNRTKTFIGRDDEMSFIENNLLDEDNKNHILVICGLGGTGKTSLAIEYSWKHNDFYSGGIFWMSAESNEALEDALQRLAIDVNTVGENSKETMLKSLKWMASIQERWLLVIDNLDQDELFGNTKELVFGSWRRISEGHIIITSRRVSTEAEVDFGVQKHECITLDVLTIQESKQFMVSRTEVVEDDHSLNLIAEELGGLPLALEQAGAHIKALKCSYGDYLEKFQKRRIKFLKACKPGYTMSKSRTAVTTTWQLNFDYVSKHSDEECLGNSAVTVMEVTSFLYADEIPIAILNTGSPEVCNVDLVECLSDRIGSRQILEILTRFSLFHLSGNDTFTVHRLVQEVIRGNILDINHKIYVLQCALRMIHKALKSTQSPYEALKEDHIGRTSLQLWSKLALHANTLKKYLLDFSKHKDWYKTLCLNFETSHLLQTSAVYHSLFQRQDEALAAQDQMLNILTAIDATDEECRSIINIKVPLLSKDRIMIQSCIQALVGDISNTVDVPTPDPGPLRIKGNEAFSKGKYHEAVQCYAEAVSASTGSIDAKLLSNKSLAHLRLFDYEAAYIDANRCIEIDPTSWKAYVWKAYAIAGLMDTKQLSSSWEAVGLAAAAVAAHYNKQCLLEYKLKIHYPVVRYRMIENEKDLSSSIGSLINMAHTTLLLRKGKYKINPDGPPLTKGVQIIGIEENVEILGNFCFYKPDKAMFTVDIIIEPQINVHFENVSFPENTRQIQVCSGIRGTFYRCRFSNGDKGCDNFPNCDGGNGCINEDGGKCRDLFKSQIYASFKQPSGEVGYAGIVASFGGHVVIENCTLDRCGGGGALSDGAGSTLLIKNSEIINMRQCGVEARDGGSMTIEKCLITNNQSHGVLVDKKGRANIQNCSIQGNKGEGVWCGGIMSQTRGIGYPNCDVNSENYAVCVIHNSVICQNGMSGFSLDGGSFDISGNRIFENWLWGVYLKSRSTVNIANNDIFENKCGGIRIGVNYSSPVVIDGNSIRDHSGPAVHSEYVQSFRTSTTKMHQILIKTGAGGMNDEVNVYSIPAMVTSRNIFKDNNKGQQHPTGLIHLFQTCCFCHSVVNLKHCSKCKKAAYCSKPCQEKHWIRHKHICKILRQVFTIELNLSKTKSTKEHLRSSGLPPMKLALMSFEELMSIRSKDPEPDKKESTKFIVKIQSGNEYTTYDPQTLMRLYDHSLKLDFMFQNPDIYHLVNECGVLTNSKVSVKKIFCWASYRNAGKIICLHTDNLPPFQAW